MAVIAPLRQPQSGLDALYSGFNNTQDIFNNIMAQARARETLPYEMALKQAEVQNYNRMAQESPQKMELLRQQLELAKQRQSLMPSLPQKEQSAINVKTQSAQNINDLKEAQKLEDQMRSLKGYSDAAVTVSNLLNKRPDLTGNIQSLKNSLNLSNDEDVGAFNNAAGYLLGKGARDLSNVGGARVSAIAQTQKPNIAKGNEWNKGTVNEIHRNIKSAYEDMAKEYERKTGKKAPVQLGEFYNNFENKNKPSESSSTSMAASSSTEKPLVILYKGQEEYRIPSDVYRKNKNSAKLKGYTLEPT